MGSNIPSSYETNSVLNCLSENFEKLSIVDQLRISALYMNFIDGIKCVFDNYPDILIKQMPKGFRFNGK